LLAVENAPAPNAPTGQPIAPCTLRASSDSSISGYASTTSAAAAPKVVLPSSDADYLSNPKPPYPPMSKRLNEQGKVVVRVLISSTGQPLKAELKQSSGYDRLDQSALATVMKWRYVPGKRNGVAEDMAFNVPITFLLE
jgi:protein TonB